jgi:hypothetical protein
MYDSTRELVDALQATPDVLSGLMRDVTPERARAAHGEGEWSVVMVVCHLRDAEERALQRMRAMRDEHDPTISGYDQEAWASERNYAADDMRSALAAFLRLRAVHVAELAALSPAEWERTGTHAEAGVITISNHTLHILYHDAVHTAQLARALAA